MARSKSLKHSFFFFNDTATTEIYTLSLHDALPIYLGFIETPYRIVKNGKVSDEIRWLSARSEEHTSELQSQSNLVCRLLLEKKTKNQLIRKKVSIIARTTRLTHD